MESCYKVFKKEVLDQLKLKEDRFVFEPEITAKIAKLKCRIFEVGISYSGRTYAEGKKNRVERRGEGVLVYSEVQLGREIIARSMELEA